MKQRTLLYAAALGAFITAVGHTIGIFTPIPAEQTEVSAAYNMMQRTMVPLPMGVKHSYAEIFFGNNILLSVFLAVMAAIFAMLAGSELNRDLKRVLFALGCGAAAVSIVSAFCFFPLPAVLTGMAALIAVFVALKK